MIKNYKLLICAWVLITSGVVSAQEQNLDAEALEVRQFIERLSIHMEAGDLTSVGEMYSPERGVHIIEGAGVNHGWEEYRDDHLEPELQAFRNLEYRYFAIEPQVRDNIAYAAFRYELIADTEDSQIDIEGRGTIILEKMSGQWKIVHIHTSGRPR
jgi:ketosteroid isomerase-like protein